MADGILNMGMIKKVLRAVITTFWITASIVAYLQSCTVNTKDNNDSIDKETAEVKPQADSEESLYYYLDNENVLHTDKYCTYMPSDEGDGSRDCSVIFVRRNDYNAIAHYLNQNRMRYCNTCFSVKEYQKIEDNITTTYND